MRFSIQILLLLIYCFISCTGYSGEYFLKEDRPYDPFEIRIPQTIWRQALRPTPVLKSPVTIVVPVHVQSEEDYIEADEDDLQDTTETVQVEETTVQSDPIVEDPVVANDTVVANATTVEDEIITTTTPAPEEVTGQVFRFPCACRNGECGCCTGAILQRFNMKACGNISFIPEDFVFDVRLSVNNRTVVRRRVSASDPPPICFNPGRAPFVEICAEISNIRIRNRNAYACLDIDANIGGFPVYSASFRCFGLGTKGIQTGLKPKPVSSGPKPVSLFGGGGGGSSSDDGGGILGNVAGAVLGEEGGIFGGGGSDDDDDDDDGPFGAIGDAVGDLFDGRKLN
ncbi:uncharacterized protein LOC106138142 [Amyelois transitella]|uniref:uncharacterized protein LOC106138142 n=1 Tax=Amyelois transitella TaxID=680683 RepID=UPI00298FBF84|nr:uncharacterized protein LOC106138142 [Amyelois transitella]